LKDSDFLKQMRKKLDQSSPGVRNSFAHKAFGANVGGNKSRTTKELGILGLSRNEIKKGRRTDKTIIDPYGRKVRVISDTKHGLY